MTARTANIDLALTIVSAAAANLGMAIDAVEGGVQIKLNKAVNIERSTSSKPPRRWKRTCKPRAPQSPPASQHCVPKYASRHWSKS